MTPKEHELAQLIFRAHTDDLNLSAQGRLHYRFKAEKTAKQILRLLDDAPTRSRTHRTVRVYNRDPKTHGAGTPL